MNRTERIEALLDNIPYVETGTVRDFDDLSSYNLLDEWIQWTMVDDRPLWGLLPTADLQLL